jgi:hypothetical protein
MIDIHDAIKDRENQVSILQAQISVVHSEIEALRIAARILEGGSLPSSVAVPAAVQAMANSGGAEKTRVWP